MAKVRIDRRKDYREQLRLFVTLSNAVRIKIRQLFKSYGKKAENHFLRSQSIPDQFYLDLFEELLEILTQSTSRIMKEVDTRLRRTRLIKQEDEMETIINAYVAQYTAQNVRNITDTTRNNLKKEIELGINAGLSIAQISKNIRKNKSFSPVRATLIARTESHQAMNHGNQEMAKRLGLNKPIKEWASALDVRTRSWHSDMNGKRVEIDRDFIVNTPIKGGGIVEKPMAYAGDSKGGASNVINCRCFILYYDSDDLVE